MALIAIKCQNCGSPLQVDSASHSYHCPYCHSTYAMEETVNNYVTNNSTTIAHVENMIDDGTGKLGQEIAGGNAQLRLHNYAQAEKIFLGLSGKFAHRYETWVGLARAVSHDFSIQPRGRREFMNVLEWMRSALKTAPEEEKASLNALYENYNAQWKPYEDELCAKRTNKLADIDRAQKEFLAPIDGEIGIASERVNRKEKKIAKLKKFSRIVPLVTCGIVALLMLVTEIMSKSSFMTCLFNTAFLGLLIGYLPVRIVFAVITRLGRVPSEISIKNAEDRIAELKNKARIQVAVLERQQNDVIHETAWLDE